MISANITASLYLVTGILFIMALRGLSSPETSRTGNFLGILGMTLAIIVTLLSCLLYTSDAADVYSV